MGPFSKIFYSFFLILIGNLFGQQESTGSVVPCIPAFQGSGDYYIQFSYNTSGSLICINLTFDSTVTLNKNIITSLYGSGPTTALPITNSWVPFSLAAVQPTDGTQLWCFVSNPMPVGLIWPSLAEETITLISDPNVAVLNPPEQYIRQTLVQPGPQPANNNLGLSMNQYPLWSRNEPGCSNNPGVFFGSTSLLSNEIRSQVSMLTGF